MGCALCSGAATAARGMNLGRLTFGHGSRVWPWGTCPHQERGQSAAASTLLGLGSQPSGGVRAMGGGRRGLPQNPWRARCPVGPEPAGRGPWTPETGKKKGDRQPRKRANDTLSRARTRTQGLCRGVKQIKRSLRCRNAPPALAARRRNPHWRRRAAAARAAGVWCDRREAEESRPPKAAHRQPGRRAAGLNDSVPRSRGSRRGEGRRRTPGAGVGESGRALCSASRLYVRAWCVGRARAR